MQFDDLIPRAQVTLTRRGTSVLGEREARLLDAVDRVRSIKDAAGEAGISYRTAWSAIQQLEEALDRPMVVSRAGGPGGGATTLTEECRQLLALYQELQRWLEQGLMRAWEMPEPASAGTNASAPARSPPGAPAVGSSAAPLR